ncbi:hypothetical protein TERTU_3110 [Teredinibacter turnerae T7901]|uniref:Uncharacterized protein n=1 Tax=Teredinibacter turnerae (strain ATCC 39867 / T7901) TaxID=377629 RepID=C5BP87_TERTT|nr:hypothetical protein TERTU_3110 [Teredinibacter turnerae T7901]
MKRAAARILKNYGNSRSSRARGLKPIAAELQAQALEFALLASAWIETIRM